MLPPADGAFHLTPSHTLSAECVHACVHACVCRHKFMNHTEKLLEYSIPFFIKKSHNAFSLGEYFATTHLKSYKCNTQGIFSFKLHTFNFIYFVLRHKHVKCGEGIKAA